MRSRFKVIVALLCTLTLAVTPMFGAWGVSSGDMTASDQKLANVQVGSITAHRIDSFKLDGEYFYKSLGNDANKPTLTLSTSKLQDIVNNDLLPQWSAVAASVFRDQAGQLVDLYGYQNSGGNMSKAGFDAYFNTDKSWVSDVSDQDFAVGNLRDQLKQTWGASKGEQGEDYFSVTGVKQVNSLSEARTMMGQALRDAENNDSLPATDFLDLVKDGGDNERLGALNSDDQTTGFANVVTSVNCKGSSADFDYVTFGIVIYDFEPVPVAAHNLTYQTGLLYTDVADKGTNDSAIENKQQQEILHSAMLGDAVTETDSTTISALASAKLSENIGANIGVSSTESSSDTSFWADDDSFGASTTTSSETISMGANWGAAWEMAGSLGAQKGHSTSKEVSKAVQTSVLLPPHTATNLTQKTTSTTYTQMYQQPVVLDYKVAIYAMSGDYYSSSAFGGIGRISADSYDKQSLVIKFDTKSDARASYGCAATDDLYSRAITNKGVADYDTAGGRTYSTHSTASGWSESKDIDWDSVMSTANSYYGVKIDGNVNAANWKDAGVARTNYFYETLGKLNVVEDKTASNVGNLYPLYDLVKVETPKTVYKLYTNDTLDRQSLPLTGYDRDDVPFYGFKSTWGEWNRCDENGNVINNGYLLDSDPVRIEGGDKLVPKSDARGGMIYLTWKIENQNAKPVTGEHPEGQNLATSNISTPVVRIDIVDSALDNPKITVKNSSATCLYNTQLNLNAAFEVEVTDSNDAVISVQPKWQPRDYTNVKIDSDTGEVTFTQPGTYKVRPYIYNSASERVYTDWLDVTVSEHNLKLVDGKSPTCTTDGSQAYYKCIDESCGKIFSDAEGKNEITLDSDSLRIPATGHDWGEWTTVKKPEGDTPGEQQRVCKNDASHVEKCNLYSVRFNVNGHGAVPATQVVVSGTSASMPEAPTADGYKFEGWFTDSACTTPYDFYGSSVESNLVLYAKWSTVQRTVAATAIEGATVSRIVENKDVWKDEDWAREVSPSLHGSIRIESADKNETDEGYAYSYKSAERGTIITLTVSPNSGYGLKEITAVPVSGSKTGAPFTPAKTGDNTYTLTVQDTDVWVGASFGQVNVKYDGNRPAEATATVANVPAAEAIAYGGAPTKLNEKPTLQGYDFGGWFTDAACTKLCMNTASLTSDTTLYAKWIEAAAVKHTVTYTLLWTPDPADASDTGTYSESYEVEHGAYAYDPTNDLYAVAGKDLLAAYELQKSGDLCWYTNNASGVLTQPFNFTVMAINEDTHLYAKVIDKKYTVTYFDGAKQLGTQDVAYNKPIGTLGIPEPTRAGYTLSGWVTENNVPWNIASDPVTSDMKLYANWPVDKYIVAFDANGHGTAPEKQIVEKGNQATDPGALTADGYTFGGWFTDKACTAAYDFKTQVEDSMKLYAKWTAQQRTVTFDANGHGTAPQAQTVNYDEKATEPAALEAEGYTFGGWFTDAACTTAYDFATPVQSNLTLYAKWTENAGPIITPATPSLKSAKSPLKNKVTVSWGAADYADGYEVAVGGVTTSVAASKNSVTVVNTKLKAGKKYNVKVRAWHMNGTEKTYGTWSSAKKVKVSKAYNAKAKKKVKAYKKASTYSKKKATLKKGAKVKVLKVKGKWAKTNKGWVLKKNLKAVKIKNTAAVQAKVETQAAPTTPSDSASSLTAARIG